MLLTALLFPLLARAAVIPELISQDDSVILSDDYKVPITLGVMSRCPDALLCEGVFNHVVSEVSDKIDIGLAFIGKLNDSEPLYGVTCMHGEYECAGNIHELCAIAHTSSHDEWWPFLRCLNYNGRNQIGLEDASRKCARVVGIDWDKSGIGACVAGDEGKRLLRESVEYSKRNQITTSCTIIINGKVRCIRDSTWKECDDGHTPADFVRRINSEYDKLNYKRHHSNLTEISIPCIDLHDGHVKQIVGGTLSNNPEELRTNFVATDSAASFARLYRMNQLEGGHVVKLGPGNDSAAKEALAAWRGGLQIGGGITEANAQEWLDAGASKVNFTPFRADRTLILSPPVQQIIVTSYLFPNARFSLPRLQSLCRLVGRERLVVDVSPGSGVPLFLIATPFWGVYMKIFHRLKALFGLRRLRA
ncbi:hypothetical protein RhiTH_002831 [Rhizoctonia solani]